MPCRSERFRSIPWLGILDEEDKLLAPSTPPGEEEPIGFPIEKKSRESIIYLHPPAAYLRGDERAHTGVDLGRTKGERRSNSHAAANKRRPPLSPVSGRGKALTSAFSPPICASYRVPRLPLRIVAAASLRVYHL